MPRTRVMISKRALSIIASHVQLVTQVPTLVRLTSWIMLCLARLACPYGLSCSDFFWNTLSTSNGPAPLPCQVLHRSLCLIGLYGGSLVDKSVGYAWPCQEVARPHLHTHQPSIGPPPRSPNVGRYLRVGCVNLASLVRILSCLTVTCGMKTWYNVGASSSLSAVPPGFLLSTAGSTNNLLSL